MLSEDNSVNVSLSDDEKPVEHTLEPPSLLDDSDDVAVDDAPSKLMLNLSDDPPLRDESNGDFNDSLVNKSSSSNVSPNRDSYTNYLPTSPQEDAPFIMTITVHDFEKRGEGIGSYVVYKVVTTCEGVRGYMNRTYEVWRRFSDFLGLRNKLVDKHQSKGVVVPFAPEKSITVMNKPKNASADVSSTTELPVRRARQLERFLRRIILHPRMRMDCDTRDFLSLEADLPHAVDTVALSSSGVKRMFKSVGEVFSKMAFHMEEGDRWFEQTQSHVEELDEGLRKLLGLSQYLAMSRRELASSQESMSRALSMLASCEDSTSLARALSHLTETEENASAIWAKQADADTIQFCEGIGEYVTLIAALKDVFGERVRVWQQWQTAQQSLQKKRENKARMELSGKTERLNQIKDDIEDTARKMDQLEAEFGELSKHIREEVNRFDTQRRLDMKKLMIEYLESLVRTHTDLMKLWEKFEPETSAIIV